LAALLAGLFNLVVTFAWSGAVEGKRKAVDRVATVLVSSAFALALVPLVSLLWMAIEKGGPVLLENSSLLNRSMEGMKGIYDKEFAAGESELRGGCDHAIVGTLLITPAAAIISRPIGARCPHARLPPLHRQSPALHPPSSHPLHPDLCALRDLPGGVRQR